MMKKILLLLFVSLQIYYVAAQSSFSYRVNHYTTEDGLVHNSGNCFVQDEFGFIWIGSFAGLERFDGYNFKTYQNEKTDSNSISNSRISDLFIDKNQTLWIGTSGGGLNKYERDKDRFTRYGSGDPANKLSSHNISFIAPASNDKLWVGTHGGGINLFDPVNNRNKILLGGDDSKSKLNSYDVNCYVYDNNGQLWIGGLNGINIIDTTSNQIRDFYAVEKDLDHFKGIVIRSLAKDPDGKIWIGTWIKGVYQYNIVNNQYRIIPNIPRDIEPYKIIPVSEDEMAIATNKGVFFSHIYSFNVLHLRHSPHDRFSLTNNICTSMYKDRAGTLWIGTINSGINKIDLYQKKFGLVQQKILEKNSLSDNYINRFAEDWNSNIWICTRKGLNKLDPHERGFKSFHFLDKYNNDKVNTVVKGKPPYLWVGTDYGLLKFNTKSGKHSRYELGVNSLTNNVITTLHYDSANHLLWVGTWGGGLDRFDISKNTWQNFPVDKIFSNNVVLTVKEDRTGNLWLGTSGKGLAKFEPSSEKMTFIEGTAGNVVISLMIDDSGKIWAGTGTEGIFVVNPDDGGYINLKKESGLPSNEVAGILQHSGGEYWISSAKGISRMNVSFEKAKIKDLQINHFDYKDGLQSNAFNQEAALKTSSGKFYFGGSQGFNVFYPDSIQLNPFLAAPIITGFELMGVKLYSRNEYEERTILNKPIHATRELTLLHSDRLIGFELSAMHFAAPEKNNFAYKLENFHDQWIYTDASRRYISFSDLMPGNYVLKIRATNNDGVWSEDKSLLNIRISPPWWRTIWFFALSVLLFVFFVALFIKYRTYELKQRQKLLERIINNRTREIQEQKNDILTQNEELAAMNDKISTQSTQLLTSHKKLELINEALKKAQLELQTTNENLDKTVNERTNELEKTVRELDHFVYVASHDLGAPLKSVLGLVNIIKLEHQDTGLSEKLQMIESSISKLEKVIFSLKQFSRNNKQDVNRTQIHLQGLVADILESMRFIDNFDRIAFAIDIPYDLAIYSDANRIKSIITNLLDNAIKYHDYNKKDLHVNVAGAIKWNNCYIKISDNGQGIDVNLLDNIFQMFYRANTQSEGSGLGLYIVQESLTKLGGKIKVKSKTKLGTTFLIKIPL